MTELTESKGGSYERCGRPESWARSVNTAPSAEMNRPIRPGRVARAQTPLPLSMRRATPLYREAAGAGVDGTVSEFMPPP